MAVIEMDMHRLERSATQLCHERNSNHPVELGKSLFETCDNGVQFSKAHYLLDSSHCEYISPVAKIEFDNQTRRWSIFVPQHSGERLIWIPYPYLPSSTDLVAVLKEIERDPKAYIW
ncbi:DUF3024 domain-containing protein [Vibrio cortegadensis]|uniref:DUF3024 domain-containing protein n=1 Tax=Vibrio cortegadensis TaxID=1328770 RepID=UPI0021C3BA05|nr:DUF3024 domain-containing protein [Vibrio cortegadensis]MDN3695874.1 DUF3024 domain-containing protein [Vibrio cortegadensis]